MKNSTFLQPQVNANRACADSINVKVNRAANITESNMSDIEDILALEFTEAVENRKKT